MSDISLGWIGLMLGAFVAGAGIVGVLALRRGFEPLVGIIGAIGMAVAGWSLVLVGQSYGRPSAIVLLVFFGIAVGAGGYAFASALLDYVARPVPTVSALDPDEVGEPDTRPTVFLFASVETQEYEPSHTARELHALADEGVLRLGIGVTPFLFAASKARYRAAGGKSPAWRELERLTEAVESRLDRSLAGRVFPTSSEGIGALDRWVRQAVHDGSRHIAVVSVAVAESPDLELCQNRLDSLGLNALGVRVAYSPPLWSSDEIADSIARRILAGAVDPASTGVVLVMHGQPGSRARRFPAFGEQESAFTSRIRLLATDGGIPAANVRTAWGEWEQPDVTSAVRHLAALGCDRILVSPAVYPFDCLATQLDIPLMVRQARIEDLPVVMLPTWHDDEAVVGALARSVENALAERGAGAS